ncbi:hypothetical protein QC764_0081070 [Podospora pseudoanserina]|uniref:Uncharacterized protein n=1 Tax=Podospora pseudoanserina TaxID=2609844 RepID=A0ABR0I764_9PEZI|nr:hypothetical protein QC764_0081070 [Podospora pseudoanserina]
MHPLTTSDLAFLLCTSSSTSPPRAPLMLRTTYGLVVVIQSDGSLAISISEQKPPRGKDMVVGGVCSVLASPVMLPVPQIWQPQNEHYLLSPDFTTSTYLWSPSSASLDEWTPADEALLESLYSGEVEEEGGWFDGYLDWVGRAEDQLHGLGSSRLWRGPEESNNSFISVDSPTESGGGIDGQLFKDEGERTLWLVEGMLLASWLALQEGVEGVGYRVGRSEDAVEGVQDEGMYLLERGGTESLGEVVAAFLRNVTF